MSCAWPRPTGTKHILIIGTGCPSTAGKDKEHLARDLAIHAASKILGEGAEKHYLPNGIEDFHDPKKVLLLPFQLYFKFLIRITDLGSPFLAASGFEEAL